MGIIQTYFEGSPPSEPPAKRLLTASNLKSSQNVIAFVARLCMHAIALECGLDIIVGGVCGRGLERDVYIAVAK